MNHDVIWKDIKGYEGIYEISNYGIIKNIKTNKIKKQYIDNVGYYVVSLCKNNISKSKRVHCIIAEAFIPNPNNYPCVNHKDENKLNNDIENLEWCTNSYNCNYGGHNKRMAETLHKTAYQKRKVVQLTIDMQYVEEYDSLLDASITTNTHRSCISNCCLGKNKTGGGYKWMYLEEYLALVNKSKNSQSTSD